MYGVLLAIRSIRFRNVSPLMPPSSSMSYAKSPATHHTSHHTTTHHATQRTDVDDGCRVARRNLVLDHLQDHAAAVAPHVPIHNVLLRPLAPRRHRREVERGRLVAARHHLVLVRGAPLQPRQRRVVDVVAPCGTSQVM